MISSALRTSRGIPVDRYDPNLKLYLPGLPGVGGTIYDYSLQANHGTIIGAVWKSLNGLWYLDFDGDDYVNCGSAASLQLTAVTMLLWAKPTSDAASMLALTMPYDNGAAWDAPYVAYSLQRASDQTMQADINVAGTYRAANSSISSPINVWKLYGMTFDGTTLRTYVNGVAGATGAWTGDITYGTTPSLALGVRSVDSLGSYWIGSLALPRVISGAKDAAFMLNDFQQTRQFFGV